MLRYGIPDYRLPPEVLDREINYLLGIGITAKTGIVLGKDINCESLGQEGFRAIFAICCHRGKRGKKSRNRRRRHPRGY
jgi:heterodisulfide reductase subunit A